MFPATVLAAIRRLARRQEGGILIEVVVSAGLVAAIGTAILSGVDGSVKTAVQNRERSVASALAEQDQERMRSFTTAQLENYSQTRTVTVRGIPYTVASSTSWVWDGSATVSCTNGSSRTSYMRLVSTVTPAGNRPGRPVSISSLMAPTNDAGTLGVMVVNRDGGPRPGLTVSYNGNGRSGSDVTNSLGCATFNDLPIGNYTITVSAPGLVDRIGNTTISTIAGVVGGTSTLNTIEIDTPVTINVNFDTKVGTNAAVGAPAQGATVESSGMASPGFLRQTLGSFPSTNNTFQWTNRYPFLSGYAAYGGDCDANDPTVYLPSYTANAINVAPGGGPYTITARLPAINIQVKRGTTSGGATTYTSGTVRVTPTDSGCTTAFPTQTSNGTGPGGSAAALPKPGYPFGNYTVCAGDGTKKVTATIANTDPAGVDGDTTTSGIQPKVLWIDTSSGGASGTC